MIRVTDISQSIQDEELFIPAFLSGIQAGFPSPAEDFMDKQLNINELVIKHPAATFFVRVEGESMQDANIYTDDILVVDRAVEASSGKIIIAVLNGEFTVKRFVINSEGTFLVPENPKYKSIKITPSSDFTIWGVVTYVIHKTK